MEDIVTKINVAIESAIGKPPEEQRRKIGSARALFSTTAIELRQNDSPTDAHLAAANFCVAAGNHLRSIENGSGPLSEAETMTLNAVRTTTYGAAPTPEGHPIYGTLALFSSRHAVEPHTKHWKLVFDTLAESLNQRDPPTMHVSSAEEDGELDLFKKLCGRAGITEPAPIQNAGQPPTAPPTAPSSVSGMPAGADSEAIQEAVMKRVEAMLREKLLID